MLQGSYDKLIAEVPKYKMITPSVLADRLRVSSCNVLLRSKRCWFRVINNFVAIGKQANKASITCFGRKHSQLQIATMHLQAGVRMLHVLMVQINGSLARAAIKDLAEKGVIRVVSKSGHQQIWTRATNTDAA